MPRIRTQPEDFEVEELPLYPPSGSGNFLYLRVEKRLANTADLARDLADGLGLRRREVGFAGRKDYRAVTRQAFTVPSPEGSPVIEERLATLALPGARVLSVERHGHRLRLGELVGNRFRLRVREVEPATAERAIARLGELVCQGMPNRFGQQRYGRGGGNVEKGLAVLRGEITRGDRRRLGLLISAVQSKIFDQVLARRPIDRLWVGDLAVVHATGNWLWIDDPAAVEDRLQSFALSPTGPLVGSKVRRPRGEAAALERQILESWELPDLESIRLPAGLRVYGDRRSLRVQPTGVDHQWRAEDGVLELTFELPPGSYATVLLEELFPDGYEEGAGAPD